MRKLIRLLALVLTLCMLCGVAMAQAIDTFDVSVIEGYDFTYCSGVGAWSTELFFWEDGAFYGYYSDSDMGDAGEGYPDGTQYYCGFEGNLSDFAKVSDHVWSAKVNLNVLTEKHEEIAEGMRFVYTDAAGLADGADATLYLPETNPAELPEEAMEWVHMMMGEQTEETLGFYALYIPAQGSCFVGMERVYPKAEPMLDENGRECAYIENEDGSDLYTMFDVEKITVDENGKVVSVTGTYGGIGLDGDVEGPVGYNPDQSYTYALAEDIVMELCVDLYDNVLENEPVEDLVQWYIRVYNEGNEMTDWSEMYPFNTNIWPSDKGEMDRMEYSDVPWG